MGRRLRKGAEGGSSSTRRPRNAARICLDGIDGKEALPSFKRGISSIYEWCRAYGIVRDVSGIFGPGAEVVTTPPSGTFHLELESSGRLLEVVINGRDLYVMGWRGPNGSYEIKEKPQEGKKNKNVKKKKNYMLGSDVRAVNMNKNYQYLAPNGELGLTKLGIYDLRRAFDALFIYRGGSPGKIEEAVGIIAVFVSEGTRYYFVEDIACSSFTDKKVNRLRDTTMDLLWLTRWSHYSGELMEQIDYLLRGEIPPEISCRGIIVQSAEEIWPVIRVLHIDGYNMGKFEHDPLPEVEVEQPIDAYDERSEGGKSNSSKQKNGCKNYRASTSKKDAAKGRGAIPPLPPSSTRRNYSISPSFPPSRESWRYPVQRTTCLFPPPSMETLNLVERKTSYFPAPSVHSWRNSVERNSKVLRYLPSLSRGSMSPLPELRQHCRLYEMRKLQKKCTFQTSVNTPATARPLFWGLKSILAAEPWRANIVEVKCTTSVNMPATARPLCLGLKSILAAEPWRANIVEVKCTMRNQWMTTHGTVLMALSSQLLDNRGCEDHWNQLNV